MLTKNLPFDIASGDGQEFISIYNEALHCMEKLGIPVIQLNTRFKKYKEISENLPETLKKAKNDIEEQRTFHFFLNAYMEMFEIIRIYNAIFMSPKFQDYQFEYKKIISGQPSRDLSKHDPSRDLLFEMSMASRFINAGFHVELNQLADIIAIKDGYPTLFIECKRITSKDKIKKNVQKANKQIKNRISKYKSNFCRGFVALNVTSIINIENDMYFLENINQMQRMNSVLLEKFVTSNKVNLEVKSGLKQLGVFVEATTGGFQKTTNIGNVLHCRGAKFYKYGTNSLDDNKLIEYLGHNLSNQAILN